MVIRLLLISFVAISFAAPNQISTRFLITAMRRRGLASCRLFFFFFLLFLWDLDELWRLKRLNKLLAALVRPSEKYQTLRNKATVICQESDKAAEDGSGNKNFRDQRGSDTRRERRSLEKATAFSREKGEKVIRTHTRRSQMKKKKINTLNDIS